MARLKDSKGAAWAAFALVVAMIVACFLFGTPWYGFIAVFLCFMAVFSHIAALYLAKMSAAASRKLDTAALVCIILAVIAFITEYFMMEMPMD